jgi:hypothetical protein
MTTTGSVYHGAHAVTPTKTPRPSNTPGSGTSGNTATPTPMASADNKGGTLCWYCHTHGAGFSPKHTSANCCNPDEPKHKKNATIKNKMGGNPRWQSEMRRSPRNGTPEKEE